MAETLEDVLKTLRESFGYAENFRNVLKCPTPEEAEECIRRAYKAGVAKGERAGAIDVIAELQTANEHRASDIARLDSRLRMLEDIRDYIRGVTE